MNSTMEDNASHLHRLTVAQVQHGRKFSTWEEYQSYLLDRISRFEKTAPNSTLVARYYEELEESMD